MTTDRELLEGAAKAAGIDATKPEYAGGVFLGFRCRDTKPVHWNPLTDDGDALRLAVQLKIDLEFGQEDVTASVWTDTAYIGAFQEKHAATRRAIVRAAYEIGKEKKDE